MNTTEKIQRGKKFVIISVIAGAIFMSGMRLLFGPDELHGSQAVWSVILGLGIGVPLNILLIVGVVFLYQGYRDRLALKVSGINRSYRLDWIFRFLFALIWIGLAVQTWKNNDLDVIPVGYSLFILAFFALILLMMKLFSKTPWYLVFIGGNVSVPKDEREHTILHTASMYALGFGTLILLGIIILLQSLPVPSHMGLFYLLLAYLSLQSGLLGFFSWYLGWR